jgi:Ca-activated chloride channel family protein
MTDTDTTTIDLVARTDRRLIRPNGRSQRFVLVELTAPPAATTRERPPVNLAFVIDRSGSMSGAKLELAKSAVIEAIGRLEARDRFCVVVYDDAVQVVVGSTPASSTAARDAIARVRLIGPGGSTNLSGGWLSGCEQVAEHQSAEGVNRTLLLTDGLANVGITDPDALVHHVAELRARGVATTTFGVGNDFDEALLSAMADAGGGHFYFIADAAQIRDHIASEVGETLEVTARDVELEALAGEGVVVEAITPHPTAAHGSRSIVKIGDLVASQAVEVLLRLTFPYGEIGRETGLILGVGGASGPRLAWQYADDTENDRQPRQREVDHVVARQFASRARQRAVALNRQGEFEAARRELERTADRIASYTGHDRTLREIVDGLRDEARVFSAPMPALALKQAHFMSVNVAHSRDHLGRSVKRA